LFCGFGFLFFHGFKYNLFGLLFCLVAVGLFFGFLFLFCVEVDGCLGATFLVVLRVVFGCWLAFLGVFGCGLRGFVSLVFMALCCFVAVVVVSACWVHFGFHWLMVWVAFLFVWL
jgi:hypothetical protein